LRIIDLTNIPLVAGTAYVKWHLSSSSAAEHRGRTDKTSIHDHKAVWDFQKDLAIRMTIEKTQMLQECDIHFEIVQEYSQGGRGGRVTLGNVKLNLAEYTQVHELAVEQRDPQDESEDGAIVRRYLLQDSKINSTLKIGIKMKQTEGDTNFIAPPLKSAMVMSGIAGVLSTEAGEGDDMPSITSKTRELSEMQDLYRRTLAATWACQAGEMAPDKLIEDIFAGGDGGQKQHHHHHHHHHHHDSHQSPRSNHPMHRQTRDESSNSSDTDSRRTVTPRHLTPEMARHAPYGHHRRHGSGSGATSTNLSQSSTISGRSSLDQQIQQSHSEMRNKKQTAENDITEFDLRDDLRSWQVQVR
jgi:hypothetical protein